MILLPWDGQLSGMSSTSLDREIRSRIEDFVSRLSGLVKAAAVESVREALGAADSTARRPVPARAAMRPVVTGTRGAKRGKRSSELVNKSAELVLAYVKAHQGQRLEEIGRGLKVGTKELKLPVSKLVAAKKLKRRGQRRGTKYFA